MTSKERHRQACTVKNLIEVRNTAPLTLASRRGSPTSVSPTAHPLPASPARNQLASSPSRHPARRRGRSRALHPYPRRIQRTTRQTSQAHVVRLFSACGAIGDRSRYGLVVTVPVCAILSEQYYSRVTLCV